MEQNDANKDEIVIDAVLVDPKPQDKDGYHNGIRITAQSAVKRDDEPTYAYYLDLPAFGRFEVVETANAWWKDGVKVNKLFKAFMATATNEIACEQAGISIDQLKYFAKAHPKFYTAKNIVKQISMTGFLNSLNELGPSDLPTVRWYLSKRHPDFQGKVEPEDGDDALQPNTPLIQTQNLQINVNRDNGDVTEAMREIARVLAGGDQGEADAMVDSAEKRMAQ